MLIRQEFVLSCLMKPLKRKGAGTWGFIGGLEADGCGGVTGGTGGKVATFTVVSLIANVSQAKNLSVGLQL